MEPTLLWRRYRAGKSYQTAMGLTELFPLCVDFREGRQWPAATRATKSLPRPVFNFCDKYVRTKRANILNQPVRLIYTPAAAAPEATALAQRGARLERGGKRRRQDCEQKQIGHRIPPSELRIFGHFSL